MDTESSQRDLDANLYSPELVFEASGRVEVKAPVSQWPVLDRATLKNAILVRDNPDGLPSDIVRTAKAVRFQLGQLFVPLLQVGPKLYPIHTRDGINPRKSGDSDSSGFPRFSPTGVSKATPSFYPNPISAKNVTFVKTNGGPGSGTGSGNNGKDPHVIEMPRVGASSWDAEANESLQAGVDLY